MQQELISKLLIGCTLAALAGSVFSEDVRKYTFTEHTGAAQSSHTWTIQHTVKGMEIRWISPDKSFFNRCDEEGNTVEWRLRDSTEDITARRSGNLITLAGSRAGKKIQKDISIDKSPWFQPISYALGRFSQSHLDTVAFWTIRPDNLDVVKLLATRGGEDQLTTRDGPLLARKIRISLDGILSHFWTANYWFRDSDGLFIRYEGVNGLPGTPITTIQLDG
jgi:hypothetical protein